MFKKMKRSMIISTVLMVVLSIVALSTATFAWFTANNTVSAQTVTMTAANATSANIGISWNSADVTGTTISFDNADDLAPMIPQNIPMAEAGTTTAEYFSTSEAIESGFVTGGITFVGSDNTAAITAADSAKIKDIDMNNAVQILESAAGPDLAEYTNIVTEIDNNTTLVASDNATIGIGTGTRAPYQKLYKIISAGAAGFVKRTSATPILGYPTSNVYYNGTSATNVVTEGYSQYDYLRVVSTTPGTGEISVANANLITGITNAEAGNFIFYQNLTVDTYGIYAENATPVYFIPNGMEGIDDTATDYLVLLDDYTKVKAGDIHLTDAQTFAPNCVADETLYCSRKAGDAAAVTTLANFQTDFRSATIDINNRFQANGASATPITLNENGANTGTTFYVKNNNEVGGANATIRVKIADLTGTNENLLRVAIFAQAPGASGLAYKGTLASSSTEASRYTYYGKIYDGMLSLPATANLNSYTATLANNSLAPNSSGIEIGTLTPQQQFAISVVVWYDGVVLGNNEAGTVSTFTLDFFVPST